ncbi:MAG TPA: hypothetical protein VN108_05365 [Marmoricola sp.]|nr:hypothetical protein [Marmoricola sp.]
MSIELEVGDSMAVLLVDGVKETPYVGATLRMTESGVEVEVPYLAGFVVPQFAGVDQWFRQMSPPENVLVHTPEGNIVLYGCRWRGHSDAAGSRVGSGRFAATEALLNDRDSTLTDPLTVKTCQSRADGLNRWSRMTAVASESTHDEDMRTTALDIRVESPEPIEWGQGDATLRVRSTWRVKPAEDGYSRTHEIDDYVVFESEWGEPRPFVDHLIEQRKVLHLLTFLFGNALSFRKHSVRDETITTRSMGGTVLDHPLIEVVSARTMRERAQPVPSKEKLGRPLLVLEEVGAAGLAEWAANYEAWERFILPSVTIIGQPHRFAEDVVTSTSMSLEAAGQLIGERNGESATYSRGGPTTATNVYRCLDVLNVGWGEHIHSPVGLARAIANSYNSIKHANRGAFPDRAQTLLISEVSELVVRLLAVRLTGQGAELLQRYSQGSELWKLKQSFDAYRIRIADDRGSWESVSSEGHGAVA